MWRNALHPISWKSRDRRSRKDLHTSERVYLHHLLSLLFTKIAPNSTLFSLLPWLPIYFQHPIQPAGDLINREHFLNENIALSNLKHWGTVSHLAIFLSWSSMEGLNPSQEHRSRVSEGLWYPETLGFPGRQVKLASLSREYFLRITSHIAGW